MLVEIEIQEDDRGLGYYCGDLDPDVLAAIVDGSHGHPFIRLRDVFWPATRHAKEDFESEIDYVVKYGVGDMFVRKADIVLISPLRAVANRDGRRLGDLSVERKDK